MPPKVRNRLRSGDSKTFGGNPDDLCETDLPTWGNVAQYFSKLKNSGVSDEEVKFQTKEKLGSIWMKASPRIVLLHPCSVRTKVRRLYQEYQEYNRNRMSKSNKIKMERKKDMLFDISSCGCNLPILECNDFNIKCKKINCTEKHIFCRCKTKIPAIDREWFKDQKEKMGLRGSFQIGPRYIRDQPVVEPVAGPSGLSQYHGSIEINISDFVDPSTSSAEEDEPAKKRRRDAHNISLDTSLSSLEKCSSDFYIKTGLCYVIILSSNLLLILRSNDDPITSDVNLIQLPLVLI